MEPVFFQERIALRYNEGQVQQINEKVVFEVPLTLFLNEIEFATLVCSPDSFKELAVGFLLGEGLIQQIDDIIEMTTEEGIIKFYTKSDAPIADNFIRRHSAGYFGKGKAGLHFSEERTIQPVESGTTFQADNLLKLIEQLEARSGTFKQTGGVHAAALGQKDTFLVMYEDIGRHNAVDKVAGYLLLNKISPEDKCLVLSGRIASEILIKAARCGIPMVLSRSAPTGMALNLADELGVCVVGFARGRRFSIYSHPERVIL
ncbi:MAG: formate dehydrogenase accessory sulfurtransferase FdhD [Chitinophagales bacterium]